MTNRIAIRRDGTFEYKDVRYAVIQGSDYPTRDGSRSIIRINSDEPGDWDDVADGFGYMIEVREFIQEAIDNDWPDLDQLAVNNATSSQPAPVS
jgi:hypothetical protein